MHLKPKIAIVTNIAWNIHNFRKGLAKALKHAGYEPVLIAAPDTYADILVKEGWTFVPMRNLERTGINPLKDIMLLNDFIKVYKEYNISFALHYNAKPLVYAGLAASYLNIPYISTITGLAGPFTGNRFFIRRIVSLMYKFSLRKSERVIFQNNEDKNYFIEKKIITEQKTLLVEGSGVDMELFRNDLYDKPPIDKLVFLMFARLSKAKGVEYYVDAARAIKNKYPDVVFRLAGPFDSDSLAISPETVKQWVSEGVVDYLGVSDHIQNEISKAHVIVYPSYYREGVPKSLIESAAMSRPIITTDNVGCREVVRDYINGFLIPIKDTGALVKAFERFIDMSEKERSAMGEASRMLVIERFAETTVIKEYRSIIEETLQKGNSQNILYSGS